MKSALMIMLLSSCALAQPMKADPKYAEQVTNQQIREVVDYTMSSLHRYMPGGWRIEITDKWIFSANTEKDPPEIYLADGLTDPMEGKVLIFVYQPCLAASSLIHELFHVLGYLDSDREAMQAVEEVQANAVKELCGKNYKIIPPPPPDPALLKRMGELMRSVDN